MSLVQEFHKNGIPSPCFHSSLCLWAVWSLISLLNCMEGSKQGTLFFPANVRLHACIAESETRSEILAWHCGSWSPLGLVFFQNKLLLTRSPTQCVRLQLLLFRVNSLFFPKYIFGDRRGTCSDPRSCKQFEQGQSE